MNVLPSFVHRQTNSNNNGSSLLLRLAEQRFILLLGLDEGLLEAVGVCDVLLDYNLGV